MMADRAEGDPKLASEFKILIMSCGIFWFSTLNMTGPHHRERPWNYARPIIGQSGFGLEALRWLWRYPRRHVAYARNQRHRLRGEGWEVAPFSAHDFRLLVHYTTLEAQVRDLAAVGFDPDPLFLENTHGDEVDRSDGLDQVEAFNVIAHKPDVPAEAAPATPLLT